MSETLATLGDRGLTLQREPAEMLAQAQKACEVLMQVVNARGWKRNFGGSKNPRWHLYVEAWLFLGHFYGITAREVETVAVEHKGAKGFRSTYEAVQSGPNSERILSRATALCLDDEENWNTRPRYEYDTDGKRVKVGDVDVPSFQLASMAQTRATSRVLSEVLRFVVGLAGYQGTPAEEMVSSKRARPAMPERKPEKKPEATKDEEPKQPTEATPTLNASQQKRVWEIAEQNHVSKERVIGLCGGMGYESLEQVPVRKFADLLNAVFQESH